MEPAKQPSPHLSATLDQAAKQNDFIALVRPALETYSASTGLGCPTLDDAVVSDLLTDLRHWCDQQGWDFPLLLSRSTKHYLAELSQ